MDQVRAIAKVLWQQRFWVLSVVGVLLAVVCWMIAAGALDESYDKEMSKIKKGFSDVQSVSSKPYHGNPAVNEKDQEETRLLRGRVLKLWSTLYDTQLKSVLQWPDVLEPEFLDMIKGKQFGDRISNKFRGMYRDYIEDRFEGLLEIVQARNELGEAGGRGGGRFTGYGDGGGEYGRGGAILDEEEEDYLVLWEDQNNVAEKMQFEELPSPLQIWVTQEDLWVYQTLLRAIADTNEARGATRPDNTAIRVISLLEVGREAAQADQRVGSILMPSGGGQGEVGEGGEYGRPSGGGGGPAEEYGRPGGGSMEYGRGGGGSEVSDDKLLVERYVDEEGAPLEVSEVSDLGPTFRRLPIRMVLMMDERYVPTLLVKCANATLPVEVKRLRINSALSGAGFEGGSAGGGRGGSRSRGPSEYSRSGGGAAPSAAVTADLAEVEIQGTVYIYFQPNQSELPDLGGAEPGSELADAGSTEVK